jgi:hypothetical protein
MNIRGMGCTLSLRQMECRKSLGCALYIGARYLYVKQNVEKVWGAHYTSVHVIYTSKGMSKKFGVRVIHRCALSTV